MPANTIQPVTLDLPFKGSRDYLHGTDMFASITRLVNFGGPFAVRFQKVIRHPVRLEPLPSLELKREYGAVAYAPRQHPTMIVGLRELPDQTVSGRVEYPEAQVIAGAEVTADTATMSGDNRFTLIERLVALNKAFLGLRQPTVKRWMFAGIDLDALPSAVSCIRLEAKTGLGARLARSRVSLDGQQLGVIYFSSH